MKKLLIIVLVFLASCSSNVGVINEKRVTTYDSCVCIYFVNTLDLISDPIVGVASCDKYKLFDTISIDSLN